MTEKILLVDDEPRVLAALKRFLPSQFFIETAESGKLGLEIIDRVGPFAVVVSDYQMPGMNGVQFLAEVKKGAADTVRLMLTGNADLQTAVDAVNEGSVFRFLLKPCPSKTLISAIQAALEQRRLVRAEKELLEKTLGGIVQALTEILSLVNPAAFSRTSRIVSVINHIVRRLNLPDLWQYQLAGLLSQIGCVTLPTELLEKVYDRDVMSEEEKKMFSSHPKVAGKLLANIPRLEKISKIVESQKQRFFDNGDAPLKDDTVPDLGTRILNAALAYEYLSVKDTPKDTALLMMQRQKFDPRILETLADYQLKLENVKKAKVIRRLKVCDLKAGMVAGEDIRSRNGLLLIPSGHEITSTSLARLINFAWEGGVVEPVRVRTTV